MSKKRIIYLDVIRILACLMIIAMHAPIPGTGLGSIVLSSDSLLTAPGIGLFIMVSGALLLPVNLTTKDFLLRRLGKVVWPTLIWTLIYWAVAPWTFGVNRGNGLSSFLSIPFAAQFNGVLWFMYMLIGLYLLAPILSSWLQKASRREVEFYLCVWAVTMCYPLIRDFVVVNESNTGILYYFGGYVGYFLLGYYLRQYAVRMKLWLCALLIMLPVAMGAYCKICNVQVNFFDLFYYLSILTALAATGWFLVVHRVLPEYDDNNRLHRALVLISNCSFGIYLCHIFIMRGLLWHWDVLRQMGGVTQIAVTTALTFAISFALTWAISYMPFSEYIIGFTSRRRKLTNTNFTNEHK